MHDIQVIQDSTNNSVLLVPHQDIIKNKDVEDNQPTQPTSADNLVSAAVVQKDTPLTPRKDGVQSETKSPGRTPRKSIDKRDAESGMVRNDISKADPETSPVKLADPPQSQERDDELSQLKEGDSVEPSDQHEKIRSSENLNKDEDVEDQVPLSAKKREDVLSPKKGEEALSPKQREEALSPKKREEALSPKKQEEPISPKKREEPLSPRKYKSLSLTKRDKSPVVSDSSNEVASEEESTKVTVTKDVEKNVDRVEVDEEMVEDKTDSTQNSIVHDNSQ